MTRLMSVMGWKITHWWIVFFGEQLLFPDPSLEKQIYKACADRITIISLAEWAIKE